LDTRITKGSIIEIVDEDSSSKVAKPEDYVVALL